MAKMNLRTTMDTTTLPEFLLIQGESKPSDRWLTLLDSAGKEKHLTYGGLLEGSQRVADALKLSGSEKNQPILIILPTSMEFLFVFWGILFAGSIPVPLYPPVRRHEIEQYVAQLRSIIEDSGAGVIVTTAIFKRLTKWISKQTSNPISVLTPEELLSSDSKLNESPALASTDTALIQYTSGSTGMPKGVELTHLNLLANIRGMARALDYRKDDVGISWLPLYHDMGLIGAILSTIHFSIPLVLFSPMDFIQSPKRWLWAIHKYRGTLSAAPNFAYSLCSRKIKDDEIAGIDLSCWRAAVNGVTKSQT